MPLIGFMTLMMLGHASQADPETSIPYIFESGKKAMADEVNSNFNALEDAIDAVQLIPGPQGIQGPPGTVGSRT